MITQLSAFSLLLSLLVATPTNAEVLHKHPRVAELEDKLAKDASTYIKGRFPEKPFLITVSIDPLRRFDTPSGGTAKTESLPYLEMDNEELQDEWDNPQLTLHELMSRVKKTAVTISLPDNISDDDVNEMKTSVFSLLHLTPARDEISVMRRKWDTGSSAWFLPSLGIFALVLALLGFFVINRSSTSRLAAALNQSRQQNSSGGGAAPMASSAPTSAEDSHDSLHGDLQFSDPIRTQEIAARLISTVASTPAFPTLQDMILLTDFGKRDPRGLGSILIETPLAIRKKLFAFSHDKCWMEAIHRPGPLGMESVNVLQEISRHDHTESSIEWNNLLIQMWRLSGDLGTFMQQLKHEEAFAILAKLPKSIAVSTARKAFPGAWASILDPEFNPKPLSAATIQELSLRALKHKPLNDYAILERYETEVELMEYLKTVDVSEERDIYGASDPKSLIHQHRKPFFAVLDQPEEIIKEFAARISPDQWALALFNVAKPERKKVEAGLSEKQQFLLLEKLKYFDSHPPEKRTIGGARERIAALVFVHLQERQVPQEQEVKNAA